MTKRGLGLIGDNSGTTTITTDLGGLYTAAGGFVNYALEFGEPVLSLPTITALAADGITVLESYDLVADDPISTPLGTNGGAFRGIQRPTADIAFLQFGGSYMVMHDISVVNDAPAETPEPATFMLMGTGFGAALLFRRRLGRRS